MKTNLDQELLAVTSKQQPNDRFIENTMDAIRRQAPQQMFTQSLRHAKTSPKKGFFRKLKHLPNAAVVVIAILSLLCLGGAAYAAIRYIPDLIKISDQTQTSRGTKEYTAPTFANCANNQQNTQKFEVAKDAPQLSELDVQKLIQARCEENMLDSFVTHIWPTYGTHKEWKNGDTIYYARVDTLGTIQNISSGTISVSSDGKGGQIHEYKIPKGQKITAYSQGVQLSLTNLRQGDTVHVITRVAEIYTTDHSPSAEHQQPRVVGIIGLVKLSQPLKYYGGMQNYLTEIPPCMGNADEYCPATASIDVYPRTGGESAANPALVDPDPSKNREISGVVTALGGAMLKLKSSSGKIYTASVADNGFSDYNIHYAPSYGEDAMLRVGTTVSILYDMPTGKNPQTITPFQVINIRLLLDGDVKQGNAKQY